MTFTQRRRSILLGWFVAVLGTFGTRIAVAGLPLSVTETASWLALLMLPALTFVSVFRGAPPPTIAEVIYAADHSGDRTSK